MIYLCYTSETTKFQEIYQWVDKWCHNYNVFPIIIRPGETKTKFAPWYFDSYEQARYSDQLKDMEWVYLIEHGDFDITTFKHPDDNVVYALGSDYDGFGNHIPNGITVYVPGGQQYAAVIVPTILYNRDLFVSGRRI